MFEAEMTELEAQAREPIPAASEVVDRFPVQANACPATDADYQRAMTELHFGRVMSDHMAYALWRAGEGWSGHAIKPYAPLPISPAAGVLHYGQEIFEGMKAYRHADDSIWTFRPSFNAARFRASARRLAMPELSVADFLGSLAALVQTDARWVPNTPGATLYLRPFMVATEECLGVHAAREVTYCAIASPTGPYFKQGLAGVSIWVSREYHRAAPGGTGAAKCGGNYAGSLLPQQLAAENNCDQVCFMDVTGRYIEELGGMNVFVVMRDGSVATPALTGTILEGGTRSAIITLLQDRGVKVVQANIALTELVDGIRQGEVAEVFACGTAAIVTPITRLASNDFDVDIPLGPVVASVHDELTGIQQGLLPDPHGWMYRLV